MVELNFFYNHLLIIPFLTFAFAVGVKWIIFFIKNGKIQLKKALWTWGMPSVHSAVVTSLTTAIWLKYGITHDLFAVSLWFTVIIIYDAMNIRYQAWLHAWAINKLIWEKFKESLGHLPSEAFVWSVIGILIPLVLYYI